MGTKNCQGFLLGRNAQIQKIRVFRRFLTILWEFSQKKVVIFGTTLETSFLLRESPDFFKNLGNPFQVKTPDKFLRTHPLLE